MSLLLVGQRNIKCECGIFYNSETSEQCPVCFQKLILNRYERPEGVIVRRVYKIRVIKQTPEEQKEYRKEYLKKYFRSEKFKEYRKLNSRKNRALQKEKYGRMLW